METNKMETNKKYNLQHEREFYEAAKLKKWEVLPQMDGCNLKVGDLVTFTNDAGNVFEHHKVLGFCAPKYDRCVYINYDCYWFPTKINNLKIEKK